MRNLKVISAETVEQEDDLSTLPEPQVIGIPSKDLIKLVTKLTISSMAAQNKVKRLFIKWIKAVSLDPKLLQVAREFKLSPRDCTAFILGTTVLGLVDTKTSLQFIVSSVMGNTKVDSLKLISDTGKPINNPYLVKIYRKIPKYKSYPVNKLDSALDNMGTDGSIITEYKGTSPRKVKLIMAVGYEMIDAFERGETLLKGDTEVSKAVETASVETASVETAKITTYPKRATLTATVFGYPMYSEVSVIRSLGYGGYQVQFDDGHIAKLGANRLDFNSIIGDREAIIAQCNKTQKGRKTSLAPRIN